MRMIYSDGILAGLLAWRSQKSLRSHLNHICELHRWHTKTISGAVVAGCGDYQTVGNHSRPMQSAVAIIADTPCASQHSAAPSGVAVGIVLGCVFTMKSDEYDLFKEKLIARIPKISICIPLGNIPLAHDG